MQIHREEVNTETTGDVVICLCIAINAHSA